MRRAAASGDLTGLRAAAAAHLAWRGGGGPHSHALLGQLDRQIYATAGTPGFDAVRWLRDWTRA